MKAYLVNGVMIINARSKREATKKALERVSRIESIEIYKPHKPQCEWWENRQKGDEKK